MPLLRSKYGNSQLSANDGRGRVWIKKIVNFLYTVYHTQDKFTCRIPWWVLQWNGFWSLQISIFIHGEQLVSYKIGMLFNTGLQLFYPQVMEEGFYSFTLSPITLKSCFVCRSTQEMFNPKPAEQKHSSHSLIELLNKVSPIFKKNFAQLLKKR